MQTAVINTRALVVTAQPHMLENLQKSEGLLETIQKGLNDYLENKGLWRQELYSEIKPDLE